MIHYEEFFDAMKELSDLTGLPIRSDTVKALHKVLNGSDIRDFRRAVVAVAESGDKPNLYALRRQISIAQSIRREAEAVKQKRIEEEETKKFWLGHFRDGKCLNHECGRCPKTFCALVSNAAIREVADILAGDTPATDAHIRLAEEFPGIGFEVATGIEAF